MQAEGLLADQREQNIRRELLATPIQPDWAGDYVDPGDQDSTLLLAPQAGFVRRFVGQFEHGCVSATNNHRLKLDCQTARRLGLPDQECLIHIRWGERNLLVPESAMSNFCTFVNGGPFTANLLMVKQQDISRPYGPQPELPAEFANLLHPMRTAAVLAIDSNIEFVERDDLIGDPLIHYEYRCMLDRGVADGLCVGDTLRALFGEFDSCEVVDVQSGTCTLICEGMFVEGTPQANYLPAPGWSFGVLDDQSTLRAEDLRVTDSDAERLPIRKSRSS